MDKWLRAMDLEILRLSFVPTPEHTYALEREVEAMKSMPVTDDSAYSLADRIHALECLQQDLPALQEVRICSIQLENMLDQIRGKGILHYNPEEVYGNIEKLHAFYEKRKLEQRERQWRHLASLRPLWPNADHTDRRRMMDLLKSYGQRRLRWGTKNFQVSTTFRIWRLAIGVHRRRFR